MFETALVEELKTITEFNNRIYPHTSPDANAAKGIPYLIYVSSEGLNDKTLEGYQFSKFVPVEFNIITKTYEQMKILTKQVISLLKTFEGRQIGASGPQIDELTYQTPVELYEKEPKLFRCVIEVTFYFKE